MNHYVYKTTLKGSDKYYIGRRSTIKNICDDKYMGSGTWVRGIKDKSRLSKVILEIFSNVDELKVGELKWITKYFNDPNNMNVVCCSDGGSLSGECSPNFGKKASEEARRKMSKAQSGSKHHNYGKRGEGISSWGYRHTEDTRKKITDAGTGRKHTEESKKKISVTHMGELNPMYGKTMTEYHKKTLISCNLGEKNYNAKITEREVLEIRQLYAHGGTTSRKLALQFNLEKTSVLNIINRKTWKHI